MIVETKQHETRRGPAGPVRTCAGCAGRAGADELVRVVLDPSTGELAADVAGSSARSSARVQASRCGRGAHVHASPECLEKALSRGGFARVFKHEVAGEVRDLAGQILAGSERRIEGLLAGARRARHLAVGADLVREALREGRAALVVVARDAAAAAQLPEVRDAVAEGRAIAWSDKARLGALLAKDEIAVCGILHTGVAEAVAHAYQVSRRFRSEAWSCPEVR